MVGICKRAIAFLATAFMFSYGCSVFATPALGEDAAETYRLEDMGLSEGALVQAATEPGTMGRASGKDGCIIYHRDADTGDYITLSNSGEDGKADMTPSFGFVLPEASTGAAVTVKYELRFDTPLQTSDKYITAGFDSERLLQEKGFGFDMFTARSMLNRNAQAVVQGNDTWAFHDTSCPKDNNGDIQTGVWNKFQIVFDMANGSYEMSVNNQRVAREIRFVGKDDVKRFIIGFGNWGGNPELTYSLRGFQVTVDSSGSSGGDAETEVPGNDLGTQGPAWGALEDATETWTLNGQISGMAAGDELPTAEQAQAGEFAAYFGDMEAVPNKNAITVRGEGSQRYVEIKYSDAKDRLPELAFTFPNAYNSGTVQVDYKLYMLPGSAMHWHESGLGAGVFGGTAEGFSGKIIHNNPGYAEPGPGGWQTTNRAFQAGGWYRYVLTIDLTMQQMKLDIYTPNDTKPTSFSYSTNRNTNISISQFVVKPYAPGAGVLCVKDVALCYVPADKTPQLLAPQNGANMITVKPTFSWTNTGADSYTLEISKKSDFSDEVVKLENRTETTYSVENALDYYTDYYWRVSAFYQGEETRTSISGMLKTEIADTPDNVYYAIDYGLVAGDREATEGTSIPAMNTSIIQGLLDKAGRNGGGKVVLPEGVYCLTGDSTTYGSRCLYINYDNLTLTGAGKDEHGKYKTVLRTNYAWDGPNKVFRSGGITIVGEPYGSGKPRQNIEISHFEMDGGRGWNGKSDWGYEQDVDYGWDISHQGIVVSRDDLVTHVVLDDLYVHSYSGETLYVGGKSVGYLQVKNCTLADTNASCFNLYAAYLDVHDNQFGSPDGKCRFWIEYCPRKSDIQYTMPAVPSGIQKDTAHFYNNKFFNSVNAHGVAIAQGDCTTYSMIFEDNEFDNRLDTNKNGIFQLAGAVYGPTVIRNNIIRNTNGPVLVFSYGGGTVDENGVPNVDWMLNKNITLEGNTGTNLGGPIIDLMGSWGVWDPSLNDGAGGIAPSVQPVQGLSIRNNHFIGADVGVKSVAIGSFYDTVASAISLKDVEIAGNIFENCTAPEEVKDFLGNVPLFQKNTYINVKASPLGGVANLTGENPLIKPFYESLAVYAVMPVTAQMRTGRNENGQLVTLRGSAGTADITFAVNASSYAVPRQFTLGEGDKLTLRYDLGMEKWQFVSYEEAQTLIPATGLILGRTSATLTAKGQTMQLKAAMVPSNASNQTVVWKSDDGKVASVSADGLVQAVSSGKTKITATAVDGGWTASCEVTVQIKATSGGNGNTSSPEEPTVGKTPAGTVIRNDCETATIVEEITNAAAKTVDVAFAKPVLIGGELFTAAKNADKDLRMSVVDEQGNLLYAWTFAAANLTYPQISMSLALQVEKSADAGPEIRDIIGGVNGQLLLFSHSGYLPGKAAITLNVKDYYAEGTKLNYYYLNRVTGKPEVVSEGLLVKDGIVTLLQDHCSEYLLTAESVSNAVRPDIAALETMNPQTGDVDAPVMYAVMLLAGCAWAALTVRKQVKK